MPIEKKPESPVQKKTPIKEVKTVSEEKADIVEEVKKIEPSIKTVNEPPVLIDEKTKSDALANDLVFESHPEKEPTPISQEEYINKIKMCVVESGKSLAQLIEGKIVIGKSEDKEGEEYEIIMIPDLVEILSPICVSKMDSEEIAGLSELFKSLTENNDDYVLVHELLELFEEFPPNQEEEEELLEGIDKLDEKSETIVANLIQYLQEHEINFYDLYKDAIYQQQISKEDTEMTVDLIDAKEFYEGLKKLGIISKEHKNLSEFLCIDKEYPDIFLMKKIAKLMEYITINLEQGIDSGDRGSCFYFIKNRREY